MVIDLSHTRILRRDLEMVLFISWLKYSCLTVDNQTKQKIPNRLTNVFNVDSVLLTHTQVSY